MARPTGKPTGGKPAAASPTGATPAPSGKGKKVKVKGTVTVTPAGGTTATSSKARCAKKTCGKFALAGKKHCKEHLSLRERTPALPWRWVLLFLLLAGLWWLIKDGIPGWFNPPANPTPTVAPVPVAPGGSSRGQQIQPPVATCPTILRVAVFWDKNVNGRLDPGEQPLAGFPYTIIETNTHGISRAGQADALEATPGRKYTVAVDTFGAWRLQTHLQEVSVPACQDKTVYFSAYGESVPTPLTSASPTVQPTVAPSPAPTASPTVTPAPTVVPTATPTVAPTASPTPVKTPSPSNDYTCNCVPPSTFVPTPSPYPSGKPTPSPVFP